MLPISEYYDKNKGLVHAVSKKGYARFQSAGVAMDYEDVFQEMSVVFLKAYEGFDESKGFKFTTYYYMAAQNKMNNWAQSLIAERLQHGVFSIEEMSTRSDGEESSMEEVLMVDPTTPEGYYKCKEFLIHVEQKLSPLAGLILNWTLNPPPELLDQLRKADAHAEYGRSVGIEVRNMARLSPRYVGKFLNILAGVRMLHIEDAVREINRLEKVDAKLFL